MKIDVTKNTIHGILKQFENSVQNELYEDCNNFRGKMNLLISKTPTSELRDEYSHMNILFEQIVNNYSFLLKNK